MDNKFKIGDKVVNLKDLYLWDNFYHYKRFLVNAIAVVEHVSEHQFSTKRSVDLKEKVSCKSWDSVHVFDQGSGSCLGEDSRVYHMVHDREIIEKILTEAFNTADEKLTKREEQELTEIELQIAALQLKADHLRNKNPDPNKHSARMFTNERIDDMKKIFLS